MLQYVVRQLRHDLSRTLMRAGAVAAVVAVILLLEGVYVGQLVQLRNTVMNRGADLIVAQAGVSNMIATRSILPQFARQDVEAVKGVASAAPLASIALIYEQGELRTPISLFVYDTEGGPKHLVAGRPITEDREIVIDRSIAEKYNLVPGDPFPLSDFEFRIAGISEGAAAYFTPFGFVLFDDLLDFYFESELAEDISTFPMLSFLLVDLEKGEIRADVAKRIEEAVPSADVFEPGALADRDAALGKITLGPIFGMMIAVAYVVGVLVTAIIMFAAINGRRHNLGVLKALGFSNGYLLRVVMTEALLLTAMAIPVGILLAILISLLIQSIAPLYLILPTEPVPLIRTVLACGAFAIAGSLLPVRMIYRLDPAIVFRS
jgi:putative ABC transport system permease protein